jgi:hypothetical protein
MKTSCLSGPKAPPHTQTNEVRRSAALIAGAQVALEHFQRPIVSSELGASAGLNLMWDHYGLDSAGQITGPQTPVLTLNPDWTEPCSPSNSINIAERAGVTLIHRTRALRLTYCASLHICGRINRTGWP